MDLLRNMSILEYQSPDEYFMKFMNHLNLIFQALEFDESEAWIRELNNLEFVRFKLRFV